MFLDKNGTELKIGDLIIPDEGLELMIVSSGKIDEYDDEVMFGQQVKNMACFSILTKENLALQWSKISKQYEEVL